MTGGRPLARAELWSWAAIACASARDRTDRRGFGRPRPSGPVGVLLPQRVEGPPDRVQAARVAQVELDQHGDFLARVDLVLGRGALRRRPQVSHQDRPDVMLCFVGHGPSPSRYLNGGGTSLENTIPPSGRLVRRRLAAECVAPGR